MLLIQTPWHEEDLQGKIQKHAKQTGEHWRVVSMPALSEGPDVDPLRRDRGRTALWPERYDAPPSPESEACKAATGFQRHVSVPSAAG